MVVGSEANVCCPGAAALRARTAVATALAAAALAACAPTTTPARQFFETPPAIAAQRVASAAEAVCLSNATPAAQVAAAGRLGFAREPGERPDVSFFNPATATFVVIGPVPPQSVELEDGSERRVTGSGCWAGSPVLRLAEVNRIASRIVAGRVVEASALTRAPISSGENEDGGIGLFFEDVAVSVPTVQTTFTPEEGRGIAFVYPVILVVHS